MRGLWVGGGMVAALSDGLPALYWSSAIPIRIIIAYCSTIASYGDELAHLHLFYCLGLD